MILSDNDINVINKFMHKLHYLLFNFTDNKILKYINKNQLIFYYNKFIRVSINLNDINDIKFYAVGNNKKKYIIYNNINKEIIKSNDHISIFINKKRIKSYNIFKDYMYICIHKYNIHNIYKYSLFKYYNINRTKLFKKLIVFNFNYGFKQIFYYKNYNIYIRIIQINNKKINVNFFCYINILYFIYIFGHIYIYINNINKINKQNNRYI